MNKLWIPWEMRPPVIARAAGAVPRTVPPQNTTGGRA